MPRETSMREVGMYLMGTLKTIFEMADQALGKYSISYDDIKYEDRLKDIGGLSFIERSRDRDGKIDMGLLEKNVGLVVSCGAYMKDRVVDAMNREKIARAQTEEVIIRDGKLIHICHFIVDARDRDRAREIVNRINNRESILRSNAKEFAERCAAQDLSISSIVVEKEKLEYMEDRRDIQIPYCVVPVNDRNSRIYFENRYADKIKNELKYATLILSANARTDILAREAGYEKNLENVMVRLGDSHTACAAYDSYAPDHYITTDSKGIYLHIGQQQEFISRMDTGWEDRVFAELSGYGKVQLIDDPEKMRSDDVTRYFAKEAPELDRNERIEKYKRLLVEHMEFRLDNMGQEKLEEQQKEKEINDQAKDNELRFDNSIWQAIHSGNSALESRLKDDRADNKLAMNGRLSQSSVDLSDLYDSEFIHAFCLRALGYATMKDPIALEAMLEEADKNPVMLELASEDKSVKLAFIREIEESVDETKQITYDVEQAEPKEIIAELDKEQTITAVINEPEMEEDR